MKLHLVKRAAFTVALKFCQHLPSNAPDNHQVALGLLLSHLHCFAGLKIWETAITGLKFSDQCYSCGRRVTVVTLILVDMIPAENTVG